MKKILSISLLVLMAAPVFPIFAANVTDSTSIIAATPGQERRASRQDRRYERRDDRQERRGERQDSRQERRDDRRGG